MDRIAAIRTFCRVVEAGSFTRAADSLNLPKGSVTKQVQLLEHQLGARLLNRTTRQLSVTADGSSTYDRCLRLLADLDDLKSSVGLARTSPSGRLRVDLPTALGVAVVLPALPQFRERFPGIDLELGLSDRSVDLVADSIDCVIRGGMELDPSLVARRVACVGRVLCAAPEYLQMHGVPAEPEDLQVSHTVVRYMPPRTKQAQPWVLSNGGKTFTLGRCKSVLLNDMTACVQAAVAGLGIVDAVEMLAEPHLKSGRLVRVLEEWSSAPTALYVVYLRNRHLPSRVRVFIDWIADLLAANPRMQLSAEGDMRPIKAAHS